eukprot:TRINITY_DN80806_c0_g1_i1.p1 TRINITY_DN80806_c0_g1~~TRINITY_DN80806_c0_g1_i1.p1  ORF type:complete len:503 (-),score=118.20 TRINITY_DN80806_c0_g1_i1:297-1805(-)
MSSSCLAAASSCEDACPLTQTQSVASQETRRKEAFTNKGVAARLTSMISRSVYELRSDQKSIDIGRHPSCLLRVEDGRASGVHLRLVRDEQDRYFIEELSSNGSFLNKDFLKKGEIRALAHGDEISLCVHAHSKAAFAAWTFSSVMEVAPRGAISAAAAGLADGLPADHKVTEDWVRSRWDLRIALGSGNFSQVKLGVEQKTGDRRAVKVSSKNSFYQFQRKRDTRLTLRSEAEVLSGLRHPNIVRVYEWFETDEHLYLVMELLEDGDLLACILEDGCFTERQARRLFRQLCEAAAYLHVRDVVHRDLKPENILVQGKDRDEMVMKLADFGLAWKHLNAGDCQTFCGTPHYLSPEIINTFHDRSAGQRSGYGKEVDMWSLGVILYVILSGVPPFEDEGLYEQIVEGKFEFDVPEFKVVSPEAKELVKQLMNVNAAERLTIAQAMEHRWLRFSSPPSPGSKEKPALEEPSGKRRRAESCAGDQEPQARGDATTWHLAGAAAGS